MRIAPTIAAQLPHREILEDALLGFVQTIVSVIECGFDLLKCYLVGARALPPRKREHPLEIVAQHLMLARCGRQRSEPFDFTFRF